MFSHVTIGTNDLARAIPFYDAIPCPRTSNPYNSRNEIVGTTKRSIAAIPSA
jgi:catechol 2,3-dioxygenase-like lactoylglutathione lyase family enzyme